MSDSRLEKFIYALCSMDVSDLPVPLSRIEKLWNCLITGETPDFEPLSRNEKYLMAMLDRYDISNLPAPMSRGEKLLYKIVVGETDLSDVPGYLSRYEELLKYLIENGGISGGDFEYVLYTLNQSLYTLYATAEKPVKSAILKGNTERLPKLNKTFRQGGYGGLFDEVSASNRISYNGVLNGYSTFKIKCVSGWECCLRHGNDVSWSNEIDISDSTISRFVLIFRKSDGSGIDLNSLYYEDVIESTNISELGEASKLVSVKMPVLTTTGKNLFNIEKLEGLNANIEMIPNGIRIENSQFDITRCFATPFKENTQYTMSFKHTQIEGEGREGFRIYYTDGTNSYMIPASNSSWVSSTLPNKTIKSVSLSFNNKGTSELTYIQLEEGSVATTYEPYKSNILTVNEPIELRGIGEGSNRVEDELDLLTGEVTERIEEVVLDGSESWVKQHYTTGYTMFRYIVPNLPTDTSIRIGRMLCDKFNVENYISTQAQTREFITIRNGTTGQLLLNVSNEKANEITVLKEWLSQNPITVQYELKTPIIKTVDLTVVDQDNQPTELGTFENVTHVSLETENLIPEVEMEVATNLLEDTVFNLTNAFNTLYPTAAKPVVDGTLYGQTSLSVSNYTFLTGKYLYTDNGTFVNGSTNHKYIEDYFVIPEGTQVITLKGVNNYKKICYYDSNKQFIIGYNLSTQNPDDFATNVPTGASYFRFNTSVTKISGTSIVVDEYLHVYVDDYLYLTNKPNYMDGAKLISCKIPSVTMTNEDNTKSTTLSTPSDLELRGIGDVKDELNLLTGELTSSLGEVVLDGTQKGMGGQRWGNYTKTRFELIGAKDTRSGGDDVPLMSDKLKPYGYWGEADKGEYFFTGNNYIDIVHSNEKDIVQWLKDNPTLIIYPLIESTIKTVDLTVVNQDGNVTTLKTFDDTTHVLLNSEGLVPEATLTVRTKIPSASSTSLLMDDISTKQEQLNTMVDEQSNNVDATMIATTEIFEETL